MKHPLASRVVAVVLLSLLITCLTHLFDQEMLRKTSGMTDAQLVQYYRSVHSHSILFAGFATFMMSMIYTMGVEFISCLVRGCCRKSSPVAMTNA